MNTIAFFVLAFAAIAVSAQTFDTAPVVAESHSHEHVGEIHHYHEIPEEKTSMSAVTHPEEMSDFSQEVISNEQDNVADVPQHDEMLFEAVSVESQTSDKTDQTDTDDADAAIAPEIAEDDSADADVAHEEESTRSTQTEAAEVESISLPSLHRDCGDNCEEELTDFEAESDDDETATDDTKSTNESERSTYTATTQDALFGHQAVDTAATHVHADVVA